MLPEIQVHGLQLVALVIVMVAALAVTIWAGYTGYRITLHTAPSQYDAHGHLIK